MDCVRLFFELISLLPPSQLYKYIYLCVNVVLAERLIKGVVDSFVDGTNHEKVFIDGFVLPVFAPSNRP